MKPSWILIAFLPLAIGAQPAAAGRGGGNGDKGKHGGGRPDRGQAQGLSSAQAAEVARKRSGGRVLSVKPAPGGYRVKVLTPAGEVRNVQIRGR
jgi:hypothetical protein